MDESVPVEKVAFTKSLLAASQLCKFHTKFWRLGTFYSADIGSHGPVIGRHPMKRRQVLLDCIDIFGKVGGLARPSSLQRVSTEVPQYDLPNSS